MKYQIYNIRSGDLVGQPYTCKKRARRKCDKLDNIYGAYVYSFREVKTNN